jgi:septal ring factor EnvC (AmiA/AmiB activator)
LNPPRWRHRFWAALLLAPVLAVAQSAKEKQQLDALRSRIEALRTKIAEGEENRTEARDQLHDSERAISEANRALRTLSGRRSAAQNELKTLARRSRSLEAEIASRQESLGRLLSLRHLEGEIGQMKLLLSGEDPGSIARDLHYYAYISRAQAQMIGELRASLASLKELEVLAREKNAELAAIESAQRKERSALVAQQAERRRVFERVSKELKAQRLQVAHLRRDESRLARLVEELGRVIASTPLIRNEAVPEPGGAQDVAAGLKRGLRLPIKGELAERFGAKRLGGGPPSKGLFIRSPSGQEVRAVAPGRVVFSDWLRGFGNLLILDHGRSYLTIYGYNEALLKQVGDVVRAGDVVATVGASGGSRESGLYFEIRHAGKAFDPMGWVSLR